MRGIGTYEYFRDFYLEAFESIDIDLTYDVIHRILALKGEDDRYRLAGSNWENRTAKYLSDLFEDLGYVVELDKVEVDRWIYRDGYLEIDGLSGKIPIYTYAGLPGGEASGKIRYLGKTMKERIDLNDYRNSIVLINLDFNIYESHAMPALEAFLKGATAVLITHLPDTNLEFHIDNSYFIYDGEPWLKGLIGIVRPFDAEIIKDLDGRDAYLKIDAEVKKGYGYNVIATKKGAKNLDVVISAHHDGYNPGVMDNLSGVAYIVTLADLFKDIDTKTNLKFISFTGEEYGLSNTHYDYLIGSYRYFNRIENHRVIFMFNVDIIGLKDIPIGIVYTGDLSTYIEEVANAISPLISKGIQMSGLPSLWLDMWPAVHRGISAVSITHLGDNYYFKRFYHTENDDIQLLDMEVFREGVGLGYTLINYLLDSYPHYRLSSLLEKAFKYIDLKRMEPAERGRYNKIFDVIGRLKRIEDLLEILGRKRYISRVLLALNRVRADLYKYLYRVGTTYPTEKMATLFFNYYVSILEGLEDILFYIDHGEVDKARERLENLNINKWAKNLEHKTVVTLLNIYRKGEYWGENATYPYYNLRELLEIEDIKRLREGVLKYYGLVMDTYRRELTNFINYLIELEEILSELEEFVMENITSL